LFLDIAEGQINMAKLYFHGETTIFERLCTQLNVCYLHYILIWYVFLRYIRLLTCQYRWVS